MPKSVGLPDIPCPYSAKGKDVHFRYAELHFCCCCEMSRRKNTGAPISQALVEEVQKKTSSSNQMTSKSSRSSDTNKGGVSKSPSKVSVSSQPSELSCDVMSNVVKPKKKCYLG